MLGLTSVVQAEVSDRISFLAPLSYEIPIRMPMSVQNLLCVKLITRCDADNRTVKTLCRPHCHSSIWQWKRSRARKRCF